MVHPSQRPQVIRNALVQALAAEHVEVVDDSAQHVNHAGARSGAGYFRVLVVSSRFVGVTPLAAQRLVYEALSSLMDRDIHALQIRTLTPEQWFLRG